MAKKTKKSENASQAEVPVVMTAKVILDIGADVPSYYVNFADVTQSAHEFTLTVGKTQARLSPQAIRDLQLTGEMHAEATLQLILPPTLLPSLISALTSQKDLYEKTFGAIRTGVQVESSGGTLQ